MTFFSGITSWYIDTTVCELLDQLAMVKGLWFVVEFSQQCISVLVL